MLPSRLLGKANLRFRKFAVEASYASLNSVTSFSASPTSNAHDAWNEGLLCIFYRRGDWWVFKGEFNR